MKALVLVALLGVIALLSVAMTALGVVIATRMQTFEGFGVISNFVVLPLYFLSGGIFPIEHLPRWKRSIAGASLALAAGAAKEGLDATGSGDPSWKDFTWDAIGAAVGVGLSLLVDELTHH